MLESLTLRDFVIVDALELELEPGFTVFSGETGAGKSILGDALALVLGERGDAGVVREGRPRADLSASFATGDAAEAWLAENELADHGRALLRRTIDSSGRSKAWINGAPATLAQLRELGDRLVDIHGQHAHQLLLRGGAQRAMLDAQGGLDASGADVADAYREWRALTAQVLRFETDARAVALEREQLAWQVDELSALAVQPGEWDAIGEEHRRLAHAASLIEGAESALGALSESDQAIASQLATIVHRLQQLAEIDPLLKGAVDALEPARIEIVEAARTLSDYLARVELDPARLATVEARLDAIHTAGRKLRIAPADMPRELDERRTRLAALEGAGDLDALREREAAAQRRYATAAAALSRQRAKVAKHLATAVTEAMQALSMKGGRFEIALVPSSPSAHGDEDVEFRVAAHPGSTPRALAKVASGGELARISLAVAVIASVRSSSTRWTAASAAAGPRWWDGCSGSSAPNARCSASRTCRRSRRSATRSSRCGRRRRRRAPPRASNVSRTRAASRRSRGCWAASRSPPPRAATRARCSRRTDHAGRAAPCARSIRRDSHVSSTGDARPTYHSACASSGRRYATASATVKSAISPVRPIQS